VGKPVALALKNQQMAEVMIAESTVVLKKKQEYSQMCTPIDILYYFYKVLL
jgi:hypothetical protein